jgi:hypothetical protein
VGGDDDRSAPGRTSAQCPSECGLGPVVETTGRFDEENHRRRSGQLDGQHQCESLALGQVAGMGGAVDGVVVGEQVVQDRPAGARCC